MKKLNRELNWPLPLQLAQTERIEGESAPAQRRAVSMKAYNGLALCQPSDRPISKMVDYTKLFNRE